LKSEERVFFHYLVFVVPQVAILSGSLLGILILVYFPVKLALAIFSLVFGIFLLIEGLLVREHFSKLLAYRLYIIIALGFILVGLTLLIEILI